MGVKISNATPPTVMILFQPNCFYLFPVAVLTKTAYRSFEISNLYFLKTRLKFSSKWDSMGAKFQNATPPKVLNLFRQNFC